MQQPLVSSDIQSRRSRSRRRTVVDENQTGSVLVDDREPVPSLTADQKSQSETGPALAAAAPIPNQGQDLLSPGYVLEMGVAGKRPKIDGICMPFTLNRDPETASMITLTSAVSQLPAPGEVAVSSTSEEETTAASSTAGNKAAESKPQSTDEAVTSELQATEKAGESLILAADKATESEPQSTEETAQFRTRTTEEVAESELQSTEETAEFKMRTTQEATESEP